MIHFFIARCLSFGLVVLCATSCASGPQNKSTSRPQLIHVDGGGLEQAMVGARTVALHPTARIVRPFEGRSEQRLRMEIERGLQTAFSRRGYTLTTADKADRLVAYAIGVTGQLDDLEMQSIFGVSAGLGGNEEAARGGIILAVIHPKLRRIVWRASGSGEASRSSRPESEVGSQVSLAIEKLLQALPFRRDSRP